MEPGCILISPLSLIHPPRYRSSSHLVGSGARNITVRQDAELWYPGEQAGIDCRPVASFLATFSRSEFFLMEYRGKNYLVFEGDEPDTWRWAVTLDDFTTRTGQARTRSEALTQVVLAVDRALSKSGSR